MSRSIAAAGVLAAGLLLFASIPANAQSLPAIHGDYLGEAGEMLPGSVTGSLPGYATGPAGSVATAVCNVGSVARLAGVGLPGFVSPICMVAPVIGESSDLFVQGDYEGAVTTSVGGVPYIGSILEEVVPTESAVDAVEGAGNMSFGGTTGQLALESLTSQIPGS